MRMNHATDLRPTRYATIGGFPSEGVPQSNESTARTDWTREEIAALFDLPFTELVFRAAEVHRAHHQPNAVQRSTLCLLYTSDAADE